MIGRTNVSGGKNDYSKMIEMYTNGPVLPLDTSSASGIKRYMVKTRRVAHMVDDYHGIPVLGGFAEPLTYKEYTASRKLNITGHTISMYSSDVTEDQLFRSYEHPTYYTYSEIESFIGLSYIDDSASYPQIELKVFNIATSGKVAFDYEIISYRGEPVDDSTIIGVFGEEPSISRPFLAVRDVVFR